MTRNYNQESKDSADHKYAYDFDNLLRGYMIRTFDPLLPSGKALELGCYKGEFTSLLASRYPDLTVIEAADSLIEIAKTRVGDNVRFICSTFEELSMDERFDAIFLLHTLEHLDAPIEILKRISGWLTDTGKLFLAVPNANAPSRQIAVKMGLISHNTAVTPAEQEHGHRKTYTFDTLEAEAVRAGLDVMARGGIFFKPLANYQFDKLMSGDVVTREYMEGCYKLGMQYPDLCASIYLICGRTAPDRA